MTSINDLAREFRAQPHEVVAFSNLDRVYEPDEALPEGEVTAIREAWAIGQLDALTGGDPEVDHSEADRILLSVAPPEVRAAYERAVARAGGYWYA